MLAGDEPALQIAGQAVGTVGRFQQQRDTLAGLVFHAPVVVDVAEHEITALLPPQRPFGRALRPAKAISQVPDRLGGRDDPLQFRRQLLDTFCPFRHRIPPVAKREMLLGARASPTGKGWRSTPAPATLWQ